LLDDEMLEGFDDLQRGERVRTHHLVEGRLVDLGDGDVVVRDARIDEQDVETLAGQPLAQRADLERSRRRYSAASPRPMPREIPMIMTVRW
jgi:hypothetical protein